MIAPAFPPPPPRKTSRKNTPKKKRTDSRWKFVKTPLAIGALSITIISISILSVSFSFLPIQLVTFDTTFNLFNLNIMDVQDMIGSKNPTEANPEDGGIGNHSDAGDSLKFEITKRPGNGVLKGTLPNLSYIPKNEFVGEDSFSYRVNDGTADSIPATVEIRVLKRGRS